MKPTTMTESNAQSRCPRCNSHDPKLHPAVQLGGEVHVCPHPWHQQPPAIEKARQRIGGEG